MNDKYIIIGKCFHCNTIKYFETNYKVFILKSNFIGYCNECKNFVKYKRIKNE